MITKIMFFGILCVSILCVSNVSYSHKSEFISKESQESQESKESQESQESHESKDIVSKKVILKKDNKKDNIELTHLNLLLKNNAKFSANFKQTNYTNRGLIVSYGEVKIEQPDKFYYMISKPDKISYISDGKSLWQYNEPLMQVIKKPLDANASGVPILILSSPSKDLLKYFVIKKVADKAFLLSSIDKSGLIQKIYIGFDDKNKINNLQIYNSLDNRTVIEFNNVKFVKRFSNKIFNFVVPKGVDVLS